MARKPFAQGQGAKIGIFSLESSLVKVENVISEEANVRIMWTTDTVKAALSIKPDKSWQVLMVPHKAELMTQYQLVAADSKPLSDLFSIKVFFI